MLDYHEIFSLVFDESGNLRAGTNKGLFNIKRNKIIKTFTTSESDKNTLTGNSVLSLAFDEGENLWIGTDEGLCQMEKRNNTIIRHTMRQEKYLSSRLIRCIYEDRHDNIWVGTTDKGLNKWNRQPGKSNNI